MEHERPGAEMLRHWRATRHRDAGRSGRGEAVLRKLLSESGGRLAQALCRKPPAPQSRRCEASPRRKHLAAGQEGLNQPQTMPLAREIR